MGYEALFEAGVKIASQQFESMKLNITHRAWIGEDGDGNDEFAAPVTLRGLVDLSKQLRVAKTGRTVMTFATVTFLDPIANTTPNSGKVREQPIDPRDSLVLPDGGTAPIVSTGGFADSVTTQPFAIEVVLGSLTPIRGE